MLAAAFVLLLGLAAPVAQAQTSEKLVSNTDLTALWPYGRWTFANGLELRGMLGAGRGEARHTPGDGEPAEKRGYTHWVVNNLLTNRRCCRKS